MINDKIKMILVSSKVKPPMLANAFNLTPKAASTKMSKGIYSINDLIKVCDYCGADLTITTKDGTVIRLNIDDIETEKQK